MTSPDVFIIQLISAVRGWRCACVKTKKKEETVKRGNSLCESTVVVYANPDGGEISPTSPS